ncbi:hypothetical protein [Microbacterium pseudoresistens]|uniref:Uncharacterized protein n=1 Tax=Microbacterium pseudoresistens TaxID=640634 RepID=A0A7Y9ETP1_9MICO|nr:hypothetical protein [Microbacterium pseudoresistens]NYD53584.1 hypothetical protein [Microbacterium pseudoresistens]
MFEELTGDATADEWALAAAIFIAQTRRRTGAGPTFSEVFASLLPDTSGLPGPFPPELGPDERRLAISGFRGHVMIEWRRRDMIGFDKGVTRSLRVGREFRRRSRQRQRHDKNRRSKAQASGRMSGVAGIDKTSTEGREALVSEDYPPELQPLIERFAPDWPPILQVSVGWYPLLVELDRTLSALVPDYVVKQIKSKFGALRFHAAPSEDPYDYNEAFKEAISDAEWRSIETCEECGAPANQYVVRLWVVTLCEEHMRLAERA